MKTGKISILIIFGMWGLLNGEEISRGVWEKAVIGGVNMTQTGFDNWVAGGESAFAWQINLNFKFVQDLEKTNWSNSGKFAYGATKTGEANMRKSVDEIKLESVLTYKLGTVVNPFAAVTGESQFAAGFDYSAEPSTQISAFLDPGYFRESFGVGYDVREGIKTRMGLALKQTVTTDYAFPYADDVTTVAVETLRNEVGAESVTDISVEVSETSRYTSKLELFTSFKALDETDVNWDNTLTVKVNDYIHMNLNVKVIYDKDLSAKRQIKQAMALGLNYTFI